MALCAREKYKHLWRRAGFGPPVDHIHNLKKFAPNQYFDALVKASSKKPAFIDEADDVKILDSKYETLNFID